MSRGGRGLSELWLRSLDAVVTAPARQQRPDARPFHELLQARRSFDRVAAAVNVVDRLFPGFAAALVRRLTSGAALALAATRVEVVAFGSGGTVFRLETPRGARALKVFRRSLGRPVEEQRAFAAFYAERYGTVARWYAAVPGLVPPFAFLVLPGPILGRPVTAVVQPFLEGPKRCFFSDLDAHEACELLSQDPLLEQQFRGFAVTTLELWKKGGRFLDLIGRENLMLLEVAGQQRLAIVDGGVFDLAALRREAPARYAALGERIGRLETLVARVGRGA